MKIGISCHAAAGGSGILATELGIALAERGHEVHFVTFEVPYRMRADLGYLENVYFHSVESVPYAQLKYTPYTLALTTRICEVAEEAGIDVWHAHYAIPYAIAANFARQMLPPEQQFKLVTTLHGTDITLVGVDPSFHRITKFVMEASDAVTAVSGWLASETRREFGLTRPVRTIYNFLNGRRFDTAWEDRCKLACPSEKIVMHLSNFRPVKRVTDVVRAFRRIHEQVPSRLVMVGEGPERMAAVGVAKQLGIADRLILLGNIENVESVVPLADLIFQPSEHESFGLVPLEAMAAGVPVLGTRSGGVVEVVEDGVTGYLCEVGDIDTMAQRAVEILTSPDLARRMGEAGRRIAQERFAREPIIDQYAALYEELVQPAKVPCGSA